MNNPIALFWFRRDLRLHDNHGFYRALKSGMPVLPLFIFDTDILDKLEDKSDARLGFIHSRIKEMHLELKKSKSGILTAKGRAVEVFEQLLSHYNIKAVFANHDYEPYALERDKNVGQLLKEQGVSFSTYKDQVIYEKDEVVKADGKPYTVFTPYSRRWKALFKPVMASSYPSETLPGDLYSFEHEIITLKELGFSEAIIQVPALQDDDWRISAYEETRNFPAQDGTSYAGTHLRFGTVSVRELFRKALKNSAVFTNELIWREFFMQILWHFPEVENRNFNPKYDHIQWRNNENEFEAWCLGKTGYPMVDAGMRQLNTTGLMHNRLRMVTASFLCKHLLIDWRWGEAYFASKLLDYELSSNNGNWQWAAGTGCDAAPYFRVFNPTEQARKFDPKSIFIKKWIPELNSFEYPKPITEHAFARDRAIKAYREALQKVKQ